MDLTFATAIFVFTFGTPFQPLISILKQHGAIATQLPRRSCTLQHMLAPAVYGYHLADHLLLMRDSIIPIDRFHYAKLSISVEQTKALTHFERELLL